MFGLAKWKVRPWWKATDPAGTSTNTGVDRRPARRRASGSSPVAGEDVDELAHAEPVAPGRYPMAPLSSVEPSKGIHAVIVSVSTMGQ